MGGGGRGLLGTITTIVGVATGNPALVTIGRTIATVAAVASGNPLAIIGSAVSWGAPSSFGSDAISDSSGWSSNAFDGNSFGGTTGTLSDIAAFDNATFGAGAGDITTGNLSGDWTSNA